MLFDPVELTGFALAIAMVICNARQLLWGWPLAIASSVLYFSIFTEAKLYGDASLQILFIALSLWGWWQWRRGTDGDTPPLLPRDITALQASWILALWLLLWLLIAYVLRRWTDTDVSIADAFVTSGSMVAMLLLARKFTVNWLVWLTVNVVSVILFTYKELWLTAVLYALLAVMSLHGWRVWRRV